MPMWEYTKLACNIVGTVNVHREGSVSVSIPGGEAWKINDDKDYWAAIGRLGEHGWELMSAYGAGPQGEVIWFKRQLPPIAEMAAPRGAVPGT